jgi:DNA-binding beta-propeller fold protein YncE
MLTEKTYISKVWVALSGLGYLWALLIIGGCSTGQGELYTELATPLYWPQPPEKPRIKYLGQFGTEDDLKSRVSSMEAFGRLIFGREEIGVLARPFGITSDDQDNLYIADSTGSVVHIMGLKNREYTQFYKINKRDRLISPIALVVLDEKIFVADSSLAKICVFDMMGRYLFSFGSEILQRPSGLAYSKIQQKLYVSDAKLHQVHVFDIQGRYLGAIGEQVGGLPRFNSPTQLWVDKEDKLYISDTLNYRIQVFSPECKYLFSIGEHGNRPGYFGHPYGIATDSYGNIYVSDKQFENIQVFNSQGQILMAFGGEGHGPGQFWLPAAIYIDDTNRIFVADSFNKRVQVFQLLEGQIP